MVIRSRTVKLWQTLVGKSIGLSTTAFILIERHGIVLAANIITLMQ